MVAAACPYLAYPIGFNNMSRAQKDCCTLTCALHGLAHDAMCEHLFAQRHMPRVSAHALGARALRAVLRAAWLPTRGRNSMLRLCKHHAAHDETLFYANLRNS